MRTLGGRGDVLEGQTAGGRGQVVTLPSLATQYVGTSGSAINQSGHVAGSTNGEPPDAETVTTG